MKREIVFVIEPDCGRVTVESSQAAEEIAREIRQDLGQGNNVNCARPAEIFRRKSDKDAAASDNYNTKSHPNLSIENLYLFRLYHNSTVDGPGRRSVIQVAGCSIRCAGFIYSLRWEKYYITHDRTEPTTYYNRSASQRLAQPFSSGFSRRASRQHRSGLSSGFRAMARLLRYCWHFAVSRASPSDYRVCSI